AQSAETEAGWIHPEVRLKEIRTISEAPKPVYLVTCLYLPKNQRDSELDWYACDFIGRGSSTELKRCIMRVADQDEKLRRLVDKLLSRSDYGSFADYMDIVNMRRED